MPKTFKKLNTALKLNNAYIFAIEGLDGSGKETASRAVTKLLRERFPYPKVDVVMRSFPDYDSKTGKEIKKILSEPDNIDKHKLERLFIKNRGEVCEELRERRKNYVFTFYIFDRFYYSNAFYQTIGMTKKELRHYINNIFGNEYLFAGVDLPITKTYYLNTPLSLALYRVNHRHMMDPKYSKFDAYETVEHMKKVYEHSKFVLDMLQYDNLLMIVDTVDSGIVLTPETIASNIVEDIENTFSKKWRSKYGRQIDLSESQHGETD